jgi:hypothetical protein
MFPKNLFNSPDDLVKAVTEIMTGKSKKEALDPVDAKALKGSHADRKDKDIDNDGDVDSSDEYLHNRRKAVMKAMKEATKVKENDDNDDDDMEDDDDEMTDAQKNDMDGDGKNDKKKKKKKDDELSDKPDKIDTKPSMDDARTMMAKEEVELDEETVYVKRRYKSLGANQAANDVGFAKKISNAASKLGLSVKMNDKNFVISGDPEKLATLKKTVKGVTFSMKEDVGLDEGKSGTGYDLYHKDFSSAMKHAYDFAKRKYGITISNDEIDDKVATGPRKPSEGKTNSYRLKGDKGAIQVQVYNKGGSKPFELNMYKEEVDLDEADVSVYKNTARKNKNDVTYAFGRTKKLDGQPKEKGGYWVWKLSKNYDGTVRGGIRTSWVYVDKDLSYSDAVKLMNKKLGRKEFKEEVELDEGKMGDQWKKGAKSVKSGPFELMRGKSGVHAIMQNGKKLGDFSYDDEADNFVANMKGMKGQWVGNDIDSLINHLQKVHKEEVELDEAFDKDIEMGISKGEKVRMTNPKSSARHVVHKIKGDKVVIHRNGNPEDEVIMPLSRIKRVKKLAQQYKKEGYTSSLEMSDVQMKKREEIVKGMKKSSGDLKKRYGDRWKDVMYATATKQAMKEEMVDEARGRPKKEDDVSTDSNFVMQMRKAISLNGNKVNFLDGTSSQVSSRDAQQFMIVYNKQKSSIDKGRLMNSAHKSLKHFKMALQGKIEKPKNPLDLD